MAEISEFLPKQATAGISFNAELSFACAPATVWALSVAIRGPQSIDLSGVASGANFLISADATTTAAWTPGEYWYSVRASYAGTVKEVGKGAITILPDMFAESAGYDGRSKNKIALDAINAVIQKRATHDQQRYTINNRELWKTPISELLKLKGMLSVQVNRENKKARGDTTFGRQIPVRFS